MASLHLAPPWVTYANEVAQMFKYDAEVHVVYDNDEHELNIYVDNPQKAGALEELLPPMKEFGSITLYVTIIPANGNVTKVNNEKLFEVAFKNNGAFAFTKTIQGIFTNNLTYVVFKNKVVQYFNDDLSDIYGQCSTLYQEIAKNIFVDLDGVFYCTDVEQPVQLKDSLSPLGEWP